MTSKNIEQKLFAFCLEFPILSKTDWTDHSRITDSKYFMLLELFSGSEITLFLALKIVSLALHKLRCLKGEIRSTVIARQRSRKKSNKFRRNVVNRIERMFLMNAIFPFKVLNSFKKCKNVEILRPNV